LETGLNRLREISSQVKNNIIPGDKVFELYDTYGFPADLTRLIAHEQGLQVDEKGFEEKLQEQKERSKAAGKISAGDWTILHDDNRVRFVGYDSLTTSSHILKYRKVNYKNKDIFQIVLDQTPFYAESGGQVGDKGWLISSREKIRVIDTIKENDLIIHITDQLPQYPEELFEAKVDQRLRRLTANNHSATHLLHAALRKILGTHVEQRGSLVSPDYLRFDFSHHSKLTEEELGQIEHLVNEKIRENIALDEKRNIPFEEAIKLGAMALFGEKYGSHVRVITFDPAYSVELCGGTHVTASGQIGYFKIISESSVAAGVRRIEAITADKAEEYINSELGLLNELKKLLKNTKDPLKGAETLIRENEELKKQLEQFKAARAREVKNQLKNSLKKENGVTFLATRLDLDAESIKNIAFELKREIPSLYAVLAAEQDGKALLTVMLGDELVQKGLNAKTIINQIAKEIQGGGGGQDFYATAGGKNPAGIANALQKAREFIPS
jgi:alanyl-tRNA synthetase